MAATTWSTTDKNVGVTLSGSNLIATNNNNANAAVRAINPKRTGKYYVEYTPGSTFSASTCVGFGTAATPLATNLNVTASFAVLSTSSTNVAFDSFGTQIAGLGFQTGSYT